MIISILGAGVFGTALGKIVTDNGHEVRYFDPQKYPDVSLEQATDGAHAVIIAIPSIFIPDFIANYPANLKNCPTILTSKGLTNLDCFKDFSQFSVLSGPGFAEDILAGKPATFTASDPFAMGLMKNDQITIELVDDPLGIILCGSLKNVYAIGSGFQSASGHDVATYIEHAAAANVSKQARASNRSSMISKPSRATALPKSSTPKATQSSQKSSPLSLSHI